MTTKSENKTKKINKHERLINALREDVKMLQNDLQPEGRISEGFDKVLEEIEANKNELRSFKREVNKQLDTLKANQSQITCDVNSH